MKKFLSVNDAPDLQAMLGRAMAFKKEPRMESELGKNKTLGMVFLNPSLRTRVSTQVAARNLGLDVVVFNVDRDGWQLEFADKTVMDGEKVEHVKEAAGVLGQYFDILAVRTFPGFRDREEDYNEVVINQFVKHAGIPVLSLESATLHPLQSFADIMTIKETYTGKRPKVVLTWAPHVKALPQAVPNSFAQWITAWGNVDFVITHPEGYELDNRFTQDVIIEPDQDRAFQDADYIYVKNWSSYSDYGRIMSMDLSWKITLKKLARTNQAKVMHCLPVRRNLVIDDDVLDSEHSIIVRQAANRVWTAQAVLAELLKAST